jgi:hypothetical protein
MPRSYSSTFDPEVRAFGPDQGFKSERILVSPSAAASQSLELNMAGVFKIKHTGKSLVRRCPPQYAFHLRPLVEHPPNPADAMILSTICPSCGYSQRPFLCVLMRTGRGPIVFRSSCPVNERCGCPAQSSDDAGFIPTILVLGPPVICSSQSRSPHARRVP